MITKEQALTERYFVQTTTDSKTRRWRANGKCKTWKTRPDEFKLPIKHGLWTYSYLTHENAHLFELDK